MKTENTELQRKEFFQTKTRGSNEDEYKIYVECAESLGWEVKTFEEWIKS